MRILGGILTPLNYDWKLRDHVNQSKSNIKITSIQSGHNTADRFAKSNDFISAGSRSISTARNRTQVLSKRKLPGHTKSQWRTEPRKTSRFCDYSENNLWESERDKILRSVNIEPIDFHECKHRKSFQSTNDWSGSTVNQIPLQENDWSDSAFDQLPSNGDCSVESLYSVRCLSTIVSSSTLVVYYSNLCSPRGCPPNFGLKYYDLTNCFSIL